MNDYPLKKRISHFILHTICIVKISCQIVFNKINKKTYKEKIKFFIQGIIRTFK